MEAPKDIRQVLSRRRVYFAIFVCLAIVGFFYWNELSKGERAFNSLQWTGKAILYLLAGLIMMVFRDLAYMIRIRLLTDRKLSWKQAFNVIMLWEFASAISPGVVGGSAVALFILEREKIPLGKSTALVIVTLIFDNLFYVLLIPAVFLFVDVSALFPDTLSTVAANGLRLFWFAYAIILTITVVLAISVFYAPHFIGTIVRFIYRLPFLRKRKEKAVQFSADIVSTAKHLKGKTAGFWFTLFGTTIWSWLARFMVTRVLGYKMKFGFLSQ